MSSRRLFRSAVLAAWALGFGGAAQVRAHVSASDQPFLSLLTLVREADAVVRGRVVEVEYGFSLPDERTGLGIPHVFVTYQLEDVFWGRVPGPRLTLRFIGGPDGRGGIVSLEDTPTFLLGDDDVLFIRDNTVSSCPLVGCAQGRFRILHGNVYNGRAEPVLSVAGGRVRPGGTQEEALMVERYPAPSFEALVARPDMAARLEGLLKTAPLAVLRGQYRKLAPRQVEIRHRLEPDKLRQDHPLDDPPENRGGGGERGRVDVSERPIPLAAFLAAVQVQVAKAGKTAPAPTAVVVTADPAKTFVFRQPRPARPPSETLAGVPEAPPPAEQELERRERQRWAAQGFNPVIRP